MKPNPGLKVAKLSARTKLVDYYMPFSFVHPFSILESF